MLLGVVQRGSGAIFGRAGNATSSCICFAVGCDCSRNVIAEIVCMSQGLCVAETHGVSCLLRGQRLGEGPLASDWVVVSGAVPPDL